MMEIEKPRMNVEENSDGTYIKIVVEPLESCLLYTSPSPRD